jgi:hypothetical protein
VYRKDHQIPYLAVYKVLVASKICEDRRCGYQIMMKLLRKY